MKRRELNSKTLEEVKRRRGRPSLINTYQWLVLLAGTTALVLLLWKSPTSMPAVGVIGATLLVFFVLRDSKSKQDKGRKIDPEEMLSKSKEEVDLPEEFPTTEEKVLDLQEMLSQLEVKEKAEKIV
jgi:hypothetical protein